MPKKNVKPVPYNSEDAYSLEEVTEEQKKVRRIADQRRSIDSVKFNFYEIL